MAKPWALRTGQSHERGIKGAIAYRSPLSRGRRIGKAARFAREPICHLIGWSSINWRAKRTGGEPNDSNLSW